MSQSGIHEFHYDSDSDVGSPPRTPPPPPPPDRSSHRDSRGSGRVESHSEVAHPPHPTDNLVCSPRSSVAARASDACSVPPPSPPCMQRSAAVSDAVPPPPPPLPHPDIPPSPPLPPPPHFFEDYPPSPEGTPPASPVPLPPAAQGGRAAPLALDTEGESWGAGAELESPKPPPPPPLPLHEMQHYTHGSIDSAADSPTHDITFHPAPPADPASMPPAADPTAAAASSLPPFDLSAALSSLRHTANAEIPPPVPDLVLAEDELLQRRGAMVDRSRENFILERELLQLDERIKLLIRNRITIQEVMMSASHSSGTGSGADGNGASSSSSSSVLPNKPLYEQLFLLLQRKPLYLARLCRCLSVAPRKVVTPGGGGGDGVNGAGTSASSSSSPGDAGISLDSIPSFVQCVVYELFGDALWGSVEEKNLLRLFKHALRAEIFHCNDRTTLLRSNSALTQLLSAYARRGQGVGVLREILEAPLRAICESKRMKSWNLEIQPLRVLQQLIVDSETESGVLSELDPNKSISTDEEALGVPEVSQLIQERTEQLVECVDSILRRILASVDKIPYGMRWICKTIGELYEERFREEIRKEEAEQQKEGGGAGQTAKGVEGTDGNAATPAAFPGTGIPVATSSSPFSNSPPTGAASTLTSASSAPASASSLLGRQIQSLQGGYIYLRFFNPVIVAPENSASGGGGGGLWSHGGSGGSGGGWKPSRTQRRNLVLIAKVLQNLSNGVSFGGKENYMQRLNPYMESRRQHMRDFFQQLCEVEDVDESRSLDRYTQTSFPAGVGGAGTGAVTTQVNQVYSMHAMLSQFKEQVCLVRNTSTTTATTGTTTATPAASTDPPASTSLPPSSAAPSLVYSPSDPLAALLSQLGPAPSPVPRAENMPVTLRLVDTRSSRMSTVVSEVGGGAGGGGGGGRTGVGGSGSWGVGGAAAASEGVAGAGAESNPLFIQAQSLLLNVLRRLPLPPSAAAAAADGADSSDDASQRKKDNSLLPFLATQKSRAVELGEHELADAIANVLGMLFTLWSMHLLPTGSGTGGGGNDALLPASLAKEHSCNLFLSHSLRSASQRQLVHQRISKQRSMVDRALATVERQHEHLQGRLEAYKLYLANVRQGQGAAQTRTAAAAAATGASSSSSGGGGAGSTLKNWLGGSKSPLSSPSTSPSGSSFVPSLSSSAASSASASTSDPSAPPPFVRVQKYSHADLLAMHLLASVDPSIPAKVLKHAQYRLEMRAPSTAASAGGALGAVPRFFLSVSLKKGLSVPILAQPLEIVLEDLLAMQEHGEATMSVDGDGTVKLNVNILVHLLNTHFMAHIPKGKG